MLQNGRLGMGIRDVVCCRPFGLIGPALLASQACFVLLHLNRIWERPEYQFLPIVPIFFLFTARQRLGDFQESQPAFGIGSATLAVFTALTALATVSFSPWLSFVAAMGIFISLCLFAGGPRLAATMLGPLLLFASLLPLPFGWNRVVVDWLQRLTIERASVLLDEFSVPHLPRGLTLEVPKHRLFVEEACSGVNGLLSILVWALFIGLYRRRGLRRILLLLAFAVFFSILLNLARVFAIAYAIAENGWDLSIGVAHQMLGLTVFALSSLLVLSVDFLLDFLSRQTNLDRDRQQFLKEAVDVVIGGGATDQDASEQEDRPGNHKTAIAGAWLCAVVVLATGAVQWVSLGPAIAVDMVESAKSIFDSEANSDELANVNASLLGAEIGPWKVKRFGAEHRPQTSDFGAWSKSWYLEKPTGEKMALSIDYPFPTEHDLAQCYFNEGWLLRERTIESAASKDPKLESAPFASVKLTRYGEYGALRFRLFEKNKGPIRFESYDAAGNDANQRTYASEWTRRTISGMGNWREIWSQYPNFRLPRKRTLFQIQLFAMQYQPFTQLDDREINDAFDRFCRECSKALK